MSSIQESLRPSPFDGLPDPRFFYSNLDRLEVLAALRFGIEGRKGLMLLTGDAGTGKTSVLRELTRELNSQVTCLLIPDPHVGFIDLLRRILRSLDVEAAPADHAALVPCCKTALRSRLETGRIVSLAFDDAHDLPDQTIESLTKIFLGKGFDPESNLLQIILAGRPQLRRRFFIPPLRALDTQVEIECRLQALNVKEIGRYIKHRLCAADLPSEIFDRDAIERIALYSAGRPGLVNSLCGRALQVANQSLQSNVTSEVITGAAKDLDYREPNRVGAGVPEAVSKMPESHDEASQYQPATVVAHNFFDRSGDENRRRLFWPAERPGRIIGVLLVLLVLGLAAASLQSESARNYVGGLGIKFGEIGGESQIPAQAKTEADAQSRAANRDRGSQAPIPPTDVPVPRSERPKTSDLPAAKTEKSAEPADDLPAQKPSPDRLASSSRNVAAPENRERPDLQNRDSDQRRDLAKQISKAIENRAILGVRVSVVDGIAYLDGRVATAQQKNAADRAARGVPEAREIRNRIAIE